MQVVFDESFERPRNEAVPCSIHIDYSDVQRGKHELPPALDRDLTSILAPRDQHILDAKRMEALRIVRDV